MRTELFHAKIIQLLSGRFISIPWLDLTWTNGLHFESDQMTIDHRLRLRESWMLVNKLLSYLIHCAQCFCQRLHIVLQVVHKILLFIALTTRTSHRWSHKNSLQHSSPFHVSCHSINHPSLESQSPQLASRSLWALFCIILIYDRVFHWVIRK